MLNKKFCTHPDWKRVLHHADAGISVPTDSSCGHCMNMSMSFIQAWHRTSGTDVFIWSITIYVSVGDMHGRGQGVYFTNTACLGVGWVTIWQVVWKIKYSTTSQVLFILTLISSNFLLRSDLKNHANVRGDYMNWSGSGETWLTSYIF